MRKIASIAVAFAALTGLTAGTLANTHMAAAEVAQYSETTSANTITETTNQAAPVPEAAQVVVSVVSGDTLSGIAADHQTTYMRLYDANEFISDPDLIYVGDQIRVPSADEQIAERTVAVETPVAAAPVESTPEAAPVASEPVVEAAPVVSEPVVEAPAPAPAAQSTYTGAVAEPANAYAASDAEAKAYIYYKESTNNPNATNYLGCYGIGQDCNGIIRDMCGADWACQDRYFSQYAVERYGSWQGALAFWKANNWW